MDIEIKNKIVKDYWFKKTEGREALDHVTKQIATTDSIELSNNNLLYFLKVTNGNALAKLTLISSLYSLFLWRYFNDFDGFIAFGGNLDKEDVEAILLQFNSNRNFTFKEFLQESKEEVLVSMRYMDYRKNSTLRGISNLPLNFYSRFAVSVGNKKTHECLGVLLKIETLNNEKLTLKFEYDPDFVTHVLIGRLQKNLEEALMDFENVANKSLAEIGLLAPSEKHQILKKFNGTSTAYPDTKTIIDLFEEQVKRSPTNIAFLHEKGKLTYRELNEQANQFGAYLRQNYAIEPDDLIGVKLERSEQMVLALFGILKSGAAYVPIDPSYPRKRAEYIERDIQSKVVIDKEELKAFQAEKAKFSTENLKKISKPWNLAYAIYTSGTTGDPKGVMIENRSLINRLCWMQKAYPLSLKDTLIQKTTYAFDVSVWEIFWWSLYGAKVSIPKVGAEKDPSLLVENINRHGVTVIHFVPSMLSLFLEYLEENPIQKKNLVTLKQVFVSGEILQEIQREKFFEHLPDASLTNLYGPTEATIDVSYFDCSQNIKYDRIPIGKPIDNTQLYIVDRYLNLLPAGVIGKLFIAGVGVGRGYVNKEELTSQKFIENPYDIGSLMYDTGDLAKWLPDGNIEFIGRKDHQIKLRGFRIELGEIEQALVRASAIRYAIVETKLVGNEQRLVAYVASNEQLDRLELKKYLKELLPKYMIPHHFVILNDIPLTVNGKVDRKFLSTLEVDNYFPENYVAPRDELQRELVLIWEEVLGRNRVGITDDFFELGGHSLMVVKINNRISRRFNKQISVKDFLSLLTIDKIADNLRNKNHTKIPVVSSFEEVII